MVNESSVSNGGDQGLLMAKRFSSLSFSAFSFWKLAHYLKLRPALLARHWDKVDLAPLTLHGHPDAMRRLEILGLVALRQTS